MAARSKTPATTKSGAVEPARSSGSEIDTFLAKVKAMTPVTGAGRGRLIFAMDATMSRQPTWDLALELQGDMFRAVKEVGGLDVQLVYFRGHGETRASKWVSDPEALAALMRRVACQGGYTQIRKVLTHARRESEAAKVNAVIYVGDCMEENIDQLGDLAGQLGLLGVPVFLFQEGNEPNAARAFKEIARLTRGAYCRIRRRFGAATPRASGGRRRLRDRRPQGAEGFWRGHEERSRGASPRAARLEPIKQCQRSLPVLPSSCSSSSGSVCSRPPTPRSSP